MTVTADQVGKLYDILIATRDGSSLACVDHTGRTQQVSQVAYMLSTTKASSEATEIQRKDQLVQLSSAQMIDRDFDAYPQVEQGDWSDGMGQRVFSGQGEALGTISNKSTKYWDGLGILSPIDDYLPQQPALATPDQNAGGVVMHGLNMGSPAGQIVINSSSLSAFAYAYQQSGAPNNNILVVQGDGVQRTMINPPDAPAGTFPVADMIFTQDNLMWLSQPQAGGTVHLNQIAGNPLTATLLMTIANADLFAPVHNQTGGFAAGWVGNKPYMAFTWSNTATVVNNLRVIDLSTGNYATFTDVSLGFGFSTATTASALQVEFFGNGIAVAFDNYHECVISLFDIPSQTWSILARFPGVNNVSMCSIAGGLFVVTTQSSAVAAVLPALVDAYLVQGGAVQHLGPIAIQRTGDLPRGQYIVDVGQPIAYGPYAMVAIYYAHVSDASRRVAVFAFDVLRGRTFKMADIGPYDPGLTNNAPRRMGVIPAMSGHPFGGGTLPAQWGLAVPVLSSIGGSKDTTNVQRLLMGLSAPAQPYGPQLQQGVQITSSLIDFTSAQNKLYRQIVADFTALPNDAAITVQLDCWFDQDPANLAIVPDFTTGVVAGGGANVGLKQLKLVTNKIARKVVYRITTTGPSATPTGAVKVISVKTQVATGWSLHYFLDIARNVVCNDGASYCFDNQRPVDDFAAHAFLKQLWRLKGGECTVTLPTGETYNAIMQLISAENVKHVIQSGLSDTPVVKSVLVELKIREDV